MSFRVQVGPPQIAIHQAQTVLVTEEDGQIISSSEKGFYFLDTRVISAWSIYANGASWVLLNGGAITYYAARIFLTNDDFLTQSGPMAPRTLSLVGTIILLSIYLQNVLGLSTLQTGLLLLQGGLLMGLLGPMLGGYTTKWGRSG